MDERKGGRDAEEKSAIMGDVGEDELVAETFFVDGSTEVEKRLIGWQGKPEWIQTMLAGLAGGVCEDCKICGRLCLRLRSIIGGIVGE